MNLVENYAKKLRKIKFLWVKIALSEERQRLLIKIYYGLMCTCSHKYSTHLSKWLRVGLWDHVVRYVYLYKKLPNCLPGWLHHFACHSVYERVCASTSSPEFNIFSDFKKNFSHSQSCVVAFPCSLNLDFPILFSFLIFLHGDFIYLLKYS